ncbi:MAG: EamA family transporter [bacterium]|nr:EamA family transporter [bacterium]MDT8367245.1 EamA family transporter [bacterium]
MNFLFYAGVVLIWGTTWFAILFQLGEVDPLVSIIYRFAIAAVILMVYCLVMRKRMRFPLRDHFFMAMMGVFLFALNYWLFYVAELYLASGLVAVIFSTMVIWNILFGTFFIGTPIRPKVLIGAFLGLIGITLVFWPELAAFELSDKGMLGLLLSLAATISASFGNITSARNQMEGIPVVQANAWGMTYGTTFMIIVALLTGKDFTFQATVPYISSLLYLAVFGSVFAFGMYLTLIGRIGADRAAYTTLLFPVVALSLSMMFEGYRGSVGAQVGILLILVGNFLVLKRQKIGIWNRE